jgi:hypothetical protein
LKIRRWIDNLSKVFNLSSANRLVTAIQTGDVSAVGMLLESAPSLASSQLGGPHGTRTALHIVADWPGYFPNGPQIVQMIIAAGGDPNARDPIRPSETPLHWAASSDDADVARALIEGGADTHAPDGSIGTPLDNAIGYGCWNVARLLVEHGVRVEKLWHAAALGDLGRLESLVAATPQAKSTDLSQAFWHACAAGQRRAAEFLLSHGAGLNWIPHYATGTPLDAAQRPDTRHQNLIRWLQERGAKSASQIGA